MLMEKSALFFMAHQAVQLPCTLECLCLLGMLHVCLHAPQRLHATLCRTFCNCS